MENQLIIVEVKLQYDSKEGFQDSIKKSAELAYVINAEYITD